jgi:hypothetical protein
MRDFGWVCCRSSGFPEAGLNWCQKTESCNYARQVTPDGGRQASRTTPRQQREPERIDRDLAKRMNRLRC